MSLPQHTTDSKVSKKLPTAQQDTGLSNLNVAPPQAPVQASAASQYGSLSDDRHRGAVQSDNTPRKSRKAPAQNPSRQNPSHHSFRSQNSSGILTRVKKFVYPSQEPSPGRPHSQQQRDYVEYADPLHAKLHDRDAQIARISQDNQNFQNERTLFHAELSKVQDERQYSENQAKAIRQDREELRNERDETVGKLKAKQREMQENFNATKENDDTVIRKQQEASFRQMESGRWVPTEESKVVGELDRLRRNMRSWAKGVATLDISVLGTLDSVDSVALMSDLYCVAALQENRLPSGLDTAKSPALLLNALLAHAVFTSFFRSPFFFLAQGSVTPTGVERRLEDIYQVAQESNQRDAQLWRSQTMRLLLPPLGNNTTSGEKGLHDQTKATIANVSDIQAASFITGPARHLMKTDAKIDFTKKVRAIYQEAATLSYQLWTRKTAMRLKGLREMECPTFNADDERFVPHTSVRYEEHEDQMKGWPITVILHPLLEVYGTDEAEDYGNGRVWARAEVWLDSKQSP